MSNAVKWVDVCAESELGEEDVKQFDHAGGMYAIYRTPSGLYASDGLCTHEYALLSDGLVMGDIIECPLGKLDVETCDRCGTSCGRGRSTRCLRPPLIRSPPKLAIRTNHMA